MLENYFDEKDSEKLSQEPRGKGMSHADIVKNIRDNMAYKVLYTPKAEKQLSKLA